MLHNGALNSEYDIFLQLAINVVSPLNYEDGLMNASGLTKQLYYECGTVTQVKGRVAI